MVDVSKIIDSIKAIITEEHRFTILSMIFSGVIIAFLYQSNQSLEAKIAEHEKSCQEMISKSQSSCDEQIKINREESQAQINQFIKESNLERDSTYRYFYKVIRSYNVKVNEGIQELNSLKDENNK